MFTTVKRYWITLLLLGVGLIFFALYAWMTQGAFRPNATQPSYPAISPTATSTSAPQSLIPSPTVEPTANSTTVTTPAATKPLLTNTPTPTATPTLTSSDATLLSADSISTIPYLERFGVADGYQQLEAAHQAGLRFGSYLNWRTSSEPMSGVNFFQMVRVSSDGLESSYDALAQVIADQPGSTYLIGNEPDVRIQDNVPPAQYAIAYYDIYEFIKARDPTALVAIGGVSQPTPLRRAYLDIVLDTYRNTYGAPLPVDIFNVHAFILREEQDNWGVGIPPGMDGWTGTLYELEDHDNMAIFQQNIIDFRAWMAERGYGDKPLMVSEYGILMPAEYGFPPESVANFMTASFDFFLSEANSTGYAPDGDRLVQWWVWYSVHDPVEFPNSNLYDAATGQLTLPGQVFTDYVE